MKKSFPLFVICYLISQLACGQKTQPVRNEFMNTCSSGEKIHLFTDRNLYCAGETIFFTTSYSTIKELDFLTWSQVLYVELITWNGNKLAQLKLKLHQPGISGCIPIPDEIPTGNYYLRVYTKWMQNFSVYDYAYMPMKVVNPYKPLIEQGPENISVVRETVSGRLHRKIPTRAIACTTNKSTYNSGEKAEIDFHFNDKEASSSGSYYITISRAGTVDTTFTYFKADSLPGFERNQIIDHLPEINGITIHGRVYSQVSGTPVKFVPVYLSETRNGWYYAIYPTNEKGDFYFSLPDNMGKNDFFIQAEPADSLPVKIEIDNGFCTNPVNLPYIPFTLNEYEIALVHSMMINQQITDRFTAGINPLKDTRPEEIKQIPFYGSKRKIYQMADYIELPTLGEFLFELEYEAFAKISSGAGSYYSKGITAFSNYPPLLFIDNIHVGHDSRLLKLDLNRIERIEIIDKGYVAGNMKYSGLIAIYSKNRNFAGIDLRQNNTFFSYDLFSKPATACYPEKRSSGSRIPDKRNLVYWNPNIQLTAGSKTVISFDIPDTKGQYMIFVRSKNNPDISGSCYFTVN
ncbi:MAG: hypothetical protein JXA72_10965 [Bacteroidales bacterium]|nr:hypothetical protein [Bacteroidales bacterium]